MMAADQVRRISPHMNQSARPKRLTCPQCLRPQRTCICHWIASVDALAEVLVLQHPLEVANAKGTARLLHLSLARSRMVTGEVFAEQELAALLHAPGDRMAVLLYPEDNFADAKPAPVDFARDAAQLRLVVLDGTWRKSRKMLHLNPLLQTLPRLALRDTAGSQYRIRKAHAPDQLSTLEAVCHALMQLEQCGAEKYAPLLQAFDGFVTQQLGYQTEQSPALVFKPDEPM